MNNTLSCSDFLIIINEAEFQCFLDLLEESFENSYIFIGKL